MIKKRKCVLSLKKGVLSGKTGEAYIGQDCGLNIENFNDIKVGDIIEGYELNEIKRKA